ncbi:MAG: hypothetical protein KF832_01550 [Caldilineaceae bacterium]|nr:hypothetical protein [Caldilineaceae bacterium]
MRKTYIASAILMVIAIVMASVLFSRTSMGNDDPKSVQERILSEGHVIETSGPNTAGSTIVVNNTEIVLPKDVYVDSLIVTGFCIDVPADQCPRPPLYYLKYTGSDIGISVGINDGVIYQDSILSEEAKSRNAEAFQWLIEAIK